MSVWAAHGAHGEARQSPPSWLHWQRGDEQQLLQTSIPQPQAALAAGFDHLAVGCILEMGFLPGTADLGERGLRLPSRAHTGTPHPDQPCKAAAWTQSPTFCPGDPQ